MRADRPVPLWASSTGNCSLNQPVRIKDGLGRRHTAGDKDALAADQPNERQHKRACQPHRGQAHGVGKEAPGQRQTIELGTQKHQQTADDDRALRRHDLPDQGGRSAGSAVSPRR